MTKIKLTRVVLDDKLLYVGCEHTCWIHLSNIEGVDVDDVLNLYRSVILLAKSQERKISYKNQFKHDLNELREEYEHDRGFFRETYQVLKQLWISKTVDGIYYSGDPDEENLTQLRWSLERLLYRNRSIPQVTNIYRILKRIYEELRADNNTIYRVCL